MMSMPQTIAMGEVSRDVVVLGGTVIGIVLVTCSIVGLGYWLYKRLS